jgi:hypothetical protein
LEQNAIAADIRRQDNQTELLRLKEQRAVLETIGRA